MLGIVMTVDAVAELSFSVSTENGSQLLNVFLAPGVLVGKKGGKREKKKKTGNKKQFG